MADTTISGSVNEDASIHFGQGFTVDHRGTGLYLITYNQRFANPPAVVLTQNYPGWEEFGSSGGDTRDNAVLVASDQLKFEVKTGDSSGNASDRNFAFIAIGTL
jgi:hypothetical protein